MDRERSLLLLITDSTLTVSKTIVIIYDSGNSSFLSRLPPPPSLSRSSSKRKDPSLITGDRCIITWHRIHLSRFPRNFQWTLGRPAASAKKNISVSISKNYVTRSVCITSGELVGICRWNCRLNGVNVFQRAT